MQTDNTIGNGRQEPANIIGTIYTCPILRLKLIDCGVALLAVVIGKLAFKSQNLAVELVD